MRVEFETADGLSKTVQVDEYSAQHEAVTYVRGSKQVVIDTALIPEYVTKITISPE